MSGKARVLGINIGGKQKKKLTDTEILDQNSATTDDCDDSQKMTKCSSLASIPRSESEGVMVDQNDIITLTQDVKCFSDGLNRLKTVFENHETEDLRVLIHERLSEVLSILKNIIHRYPALQSTELFAASGTLISQVKSFNHGDIHQAGAETSLFEAIDQLALAFSSGVSEYLMGDMGSSFAEKEDKTKSCDDLLSTKGEEKEKVAGENAVKHLLPQEIDKVLSELEAGVDIALQRAKAWSKYMKDITSYIERKAHLETEYAKNLARLAQTMRPVLTEEGFLPLQSVYCTVLSQDIEYASTCQATQILLQTSKFVEPLTTRRTEHDKTRKAVKDSWVKETKKMHEAVQSLRKAQGMYFQRQQEYEKAKEQASKMETDMLNQSSSSALTKMDKRRKLEDDAMHRAAEAETTYKACVVEANSRKTDLEKTKTELLAKIREQIFQCDQVIKSVTIEYFHLLQTVTAPVPVQYHTISETSKQYEVGVQYGEFVKRLPVTDKNSTIADPFTFEPYSSIRNSDRKTSTQSTGSGSSDPHSQEESPSSAEYRDRRDKYRVAMKAWPVGSDTDSASGSSKSSPSSSPHQTGRRKLKAAKSLDELADGNAVNGGGLLQIPPCILKGGVDISVQGITKGGRRRNTTFGVDFQEQVEQWKSAVPPIVKKCLKEVEQRGITLRGIYRVSGVKSKVEGLCQRFEKDPDSIDLSEEHPNVISNVLKLYLRQLPEPLLTFKMYSEFIHLAKESVSGAITVDDTIDKLATLVSRLPYSNFKTCGVLMYHLQRVASFNSVNQMTTSNLGIVFGPTLLRPLEGTASLASLVDTPHQTRTVELLIANAQSIFGPETDYELAPGETPIEPIADKESHPKVENSKSSDKIITKDDVKTIPSIHSTGSIERTSDHILQEDEEVCGPQKSSDADFVLPGSAHCHKKDRSPTSSEGEENVDVDSGDDLPDTLLPDHSKHALHSYKGESCMVLSSGQLLESVKRSPPQELKLSTTQDLDIEKKKINLPTITIIDSSPVHELSPQQNFATKLAPTAVQSNTTRALSESPPLFVNSQNLQPEQTKEAPTIQALIRATKATFNREDFVRAQERQQHHQLVIEEQKESSNHSSDDANSIEESNSDGKPKPSDLPPLKTITLTCPSSPLLQRHALLQAQKESETMNGKGTSPPILRQNRAKRSPPLFRTSLTEIDNTKGAYGSAGNLSPSLTRRFSGQGSSLLDIKSKSLSFDRKDGSLLPAFSDECIDMEIDKRSDSSQNSDLDMTVRSGMVDSINVRKKNVTFSLDKPSHVPEKSEIKESIITMQSDESSVKLKSSGNKDSAQGKSPAKEGKKKGPLGIVMGKAAIAARAVSSSAHRSGHTSNSSKQPIAATKSAPSKSESRKHSPGQCVMGTSAAHSSRVGHVSCATCGRRRAASQSYVSCEPPTKQQAKGKQAPVRKISADSFPRKSTDSGQKSPREESQKGSKGASGKKERKPFFV